jgi:hypothetical protein
VRDQFLLLSAISVRSISSDKRDYRSLSSTPGLAEKQAKVHLLRLDGETISLYFGSEVAMATSARPTPLTKAFRVLLRAAQFVPR